MADPVDLNSLLAGALDDLEKQERQQQQQQQTAPAAPAPAAAPAAPAPAAAPRAQPDLSAMLKEISEALPDAPPQLQTLLSNPDALARMLETTDGPDAARELDAAAADMQRYFEQAAAEGPAASAGQSQALLELFRPFVSKEIIHEPLSEIHRRFPEYLERKRREGTLSAEEMGRAEEQARVVARLCELYEAQKSPDDGLPEIVSLIEQLGQVPQEIVSELQAVPAEGCPVM
eukprot:m51a1_g7980 putative peroxisome biogenesis protein 19 (232) ;mRNA; r:57204-58355